MFILFKFTQDDINSLEKQFFKHITFSQVINILHNTSRVRNRGWAPSTAGGEISEPPLHRALALYKWAR